ncbi:Hsp33 family molecular chaperone HslO [Lachnoclostridium phytofermentans]|uniref:33 kDa chaperonin n=1 Tax=Lachnoclostridium phytofermentans (strain ATCC 700394 / DSM 18823 / ISDg) TaxID=357809 RepID=HSLO_LACP7|nr:Hsp33 family molecular chaperone HslO [Lachnoclostridium phytofermentans]A9KTE0.1 RecName: Full=33 kDa chaperonin; AltName: Full=Heat shock protein 33 homolog; Short=HSP33 [Lachnoclostridium phytofermentans ISDg]ABX43770.1 Hsp33 protein [Lachnoclostridium phytofermentans ISDg]
MNDYIIRATAANSQIRAFACISTEIVETARQAHNTSPVVTAALGRLLTGGAMMGSMMKGEKDLLTLKIACSGPIGGLTVTADAGANVKGYANQNVVNLPPSPKGKLDVGKALDIGVLSVIKDMGLKEPYVGQTDLVTGEIAEDLTYYFATSEQVPSSVALGVLMNRDNTVRCAGGFIIQLLPFAEEEVIEKLEKKIGEITSVTSMLDKGMTPEEILQELLGEFGLTILDKIPTKFTCNCTKERVEKAIVSIGKKDLQEMIDDEKPIEVNCHFCNTNYEFSVEELKDIITRSN